MTDRITHGARAALVALLGAALLVFGLFGAGGSSAATVTPAALTPGQLEEQLLVITNEVRAQGRWCGGTWYPAAAPVRYDARLANAARAHSTDAGVRNFYDTPDPHTNPDGLTPGDRVTAAGFSWTTVGENMHAWWSTPEGAMYGAVINGVKYNGWLDSPAHCANIMNPAFTFLGNGYANVPGSTYTHYWTQNFAAPQPGMVFAPDQPRITGITPGDGQLTVNFTPPVWDGGRPIITYLYSLDGGASWVARNPASPASPLVISGLTNGVTYQVRLKAANDAFFAVGASLASNTVAASPKTIIGPPGAPTLAEVTPVDGGIRLAWQAGSTGGLPLRNYEYSLNGGTSWTAFSPAKTESPTLVGGLKNGVEYRIAIRAVNDRGPGPASAVKAATPYASPASVFVPINPVRVVDTRTTEGGSPLAAGETRTFSVADQIAKAGGAKDVVPSGATAIAYNLTAPAASSVGSLSVMPGDVPSTSTAAIAWRSGESIANGLTVRLDPSRQIRITNNASTTGNAVVDVLGYYLPAEQAQATGRFTPVPPTRVYDSATDPQGSLLFDTTREINVTKAYDTGARVVPTEASSIAYVITVVRPDSAGHLRVYPGHEDPTLASTINWAKSGDVIANGLNVNVSPTGTVKVYGRSFAPVRFLVDVVGYYSGESGAYYHPVNPATAYDSRAPEPLNALLPWGQPSRVVAVKDARTSAGAIAAVDVIPPTAVAVAYNASVLETRSTGHLRLYPADQPLPFSSVLNWPDADYIRSNGGVVGVPSTRTVALYSSAIGTHVRVETNGYFK
ncbi:MAG: fibronectin type III domain-containing protein [Actinobacteria bacterium]|nr:fibronectin type III domain-containing protein [Actinomycetota bacterium]MCB9412857.1 fibronectin type III domain-containing protein [Actinomycetota bacterium]